MAGYAIVQLKVTDPELNERYRSQVQAIIEQYGGRFLVRGGKVDELEGSLSLPRLVVMEFPSTEQAHAFYNSPAYQEILPLRLKSAEGIFVIVEGV